MKSTTNIHPNITAPILAAHPDTQAIYLYGSWGTEYQRQDSDLDIAVLLPHDEAKRVSRREWRLLAVEVAAAAAAAKVGRAELINLRCVDTTFQIKIMSADRLIHCTDEDARINFEALALSMYQDHNYRLAKMRKEIIESGQVLPPN